MDDEQMKLECLKLATEQGYKGPDAIAKAGELFNFIKGRGQTDLIGGGKARVVGKDGDHPFVRFKDYKPE